MASVLLISPPFSLQEQYGALADVANMLPPLGIGYLGAALEQAGFAVTVFDTPALGWGIRETVSAARRLRPDFVGISSGTVDFGKATRLAGALKRSLDAPIIIGGPHVSAVPDDAMRSGSFDVGVVGEGEETIVELLRTLRCGGDPRGVRGIVYSEGGKTSRSDPRDPVENLDALPFPAWHLMPPLDLYKPSSASYRRLPVVTMITSRGCPNRCAFCFRGVFGNQLRFRSPDNVVQEMDLLTSRLGAGEIRIYDDTFNASPQRVKAICRLIMRRGLDFPWTCQARVDRIDPAMLDLMRRAGCWQISYGIESGNDGILERIGKGITRRMVRDAIEATHRAGIRSLGFFILGLPGETEETLRETIDLALDLPLDAANFSVATPYPGTELWSLAERRGLLRDVAYEDLVLHLPDSPLCLSDHLTAATLREYERRAYREFYRHPKFVLRQLGRLEDPSDLWRKVKAFFTIQRI